MTSTISDRRNSAPSTVLAVLPAVLVVPAVLPVAVTTADRVAAVVAVAEARRVTARQVTARRPAGLMSLTAVRVVAVVKVAAVGMVKAAAAAIEASIKTPNSRLEWKRCAKRPTSFV
jgi:hypothetical protein